MHSLHNACAAKKRHRPSRVCRGMVSQMLGWRRQTRVKMEVMEARALPRGRCTRRGVPARANLSAGCMTRQQLLQQLQACIPLMLLLVIRVLVERKKESHHERVLRSICWRGCRVCGALRQGPSARCGGFMTWSHSWPKKKRPSPQGRCRRRSALRDLAKATHPCTYTWWRTSSTGCLLSCWACHPTPCCACRPTCGATSRVCVRSSSARSGRR
mmetsp:Transcript_3480/g.9270  ORF Transcript_3480/g.9270 Transcript_3480/m.9270 type:complete len:214 (-) Transcript_3480:2102-2743(-)